MNFASLFSVLSSLTLCSFSKEICKPGSPSVQLRDHRCHVFFPLSPWLTHLSSHLCFFFSSTSNASLIGFSFDLLSRSQTLGQLGLGILESRLCLTHFTGISHAQPSFFTLPQYQAQILPFDFCVYFHVSVGEFWFHFHGFYGLCFLLFSSLPLYCSLQLYGSRELPLSEGCSLILP